MVNETMTQEPDVLPPGYRREEQTAINADTLAEEIDKKSQDTLAIDPSKLKVDREIRYELDKGELDVTEADPEYVYKWVQCERPASNPARTVDLLRYKSITYEGKKYPTWQVVTGDMKESIEKKTALGTRKLGDCMLMRCHKNTYQIIEAEERRKRANRQHGLDSELVDLAMRADTNAGQQTYINHGGQGANEMRIDFDEALRTGTIPNLRR